MGFENFFQFKIFLGFENFLKVKKVANFSIFQLKCKLNKNSLIAKKFHLKTDKKIVEQNKKFVNKSQMKKIIDFAINWCKIFFIASKKNCKKENKKEKKEKEYKIL